tara:strand:+ start:577 stop:837 length:261 start_codon:yes stop_codon:yes gene_type:complete
MALTERKEIDQITVLVDGQIQVREATVIDKDGVEISRTFHRHVVAPGADLSGEDARVKKIAEVEHTSAVITAYNDLIASNAQELSA